MRKYAVIGVVGIGVVAVVLARPFFGPRATVVPPESQLQADPSPVRADVGAPRRLAQDLATSGAAGQLDATPPRRPRELRMIRGGSFEGDLRTLPQIPVRKRERPEHEEPEPSPMVHPGFPADETPALPRPSMPTAPAPAPSLTFDGLSFNLNGAGHPPDTNGDVGPTYYIQTINTSVGIYNKATGAPVTTFTFDSLMAGHFGNVCDSENFGDPVALYDTLEDRWILTDFAFVLSGNDVVPPALQCFAVSKTSDPVAGGWYFYSIEAINGLGDYPKLGVWPDGIYMAANVFDYAAAGSFQTARVWAFNKQQMYAGAATAQSVVFDVPGGDFALLPSNARLQTGMPALGTPNYFISTWQFLNALNVYKFHVDWDRISLSTFTGPTIVGTGSSWPNEAVPNITVPAPGATLDALQIRAMAQNQYSNISGVESLWVTHTVRRVSGGFAAPRWYQTPVTGGVIGGATLQTATWDPDAANVMQRWMASIGVDRAGNVALGYSAANSVTNPGIMYAGRLAGDPVNTFSQTEQTLFLGSGVQTPSTRWGDYSSMTLDPDGCSFFYTTEYYAVTGADHHTRVGTFKYPSCTNVGAGGTLQGTVTVSPGGAPIVGASVVLGARTATTNGSGVYSFSNLPAGSYPTLKAKAFGYTTGTTNTIAITDAGTTVKDFALTAATQTGCLVDTTQADFQTGVTTNCDLVTSPADVVLAVQSAADQANTSLGGFGVGITTTTWGGQSFTPAVTGQLLKADVNLFCSGCTGTIPNLTLSVRATSGGLPTGADLASATITGFSSGAAVFYTGVFSSPPTLTMGTQYALVIRPTANPSVGTYALTRSGTSGTGADVYAGGARLSGATSGTVWSIPLTGGIQTDAGFRTYMNSGYFTSGSFISTLKDANPVVGSFPQWNSIAWTASTPAGTAVQFQAAASANEFGPFSFVGPDGTSGTFFTSGASLAQFNGRRYLKYKVVLTGTSAATPVVNDVTVCFTNTPWSDYPAVAAVTVVKGAQFDEMRTRANALLVRFAHAPKTWTDSVLTNVAIKAVHVTELRAAVVEAYTAHGAPPASPTFTDPGLGVGTTVKAVHINELRDAIALLERTP